MSARLIDEQTVIDLLAIAYEQITISNKIDDLLNCEFNFPQSEKLVDMAIDAIAPNVTDDFKEGLQEMFYQHWLNENKYSDARSFYDALKMSVDDS